MSRIDIIRGLMAKTDNEKLLYFLFPDADEVEDYGSPSMDLERVNADIGDCGPMAHMLAKVLDKKK
jgi:hypothetical protein